MRKTNLFNSQNCYQCWFSLLQLDYNSIYSYMTSQKQPIKTSFYQTLSPLQKLLIGLLSLGNIHLIAIIYIKTKSIICSMTHIRTRRPRLPRVRPRFNLSTVKVVNIIHAVFWLDRTNRQTFWNEYSIENCYLISSDKICQRNKFRSKKKEN